MEEKIKEAIKTIEEISKTKPIKVITHNDTDGITSGAIFSKALQRWKKKFSLEIVKNLEKEYIKSLPEDHLLVFLDLASGSLPELANKQTQIIILDHHEIPDQQEIPKNVILINPILTNSENMAGSALCYLFARNLSEQNKDLANLAVIGMIGDMFEKNIGKTYGSILKDAEVVIKKGLLLYPATRPLDRVLENSFSLYIPEVSGSFKGTLELLRDAGIQKTSRGFKSIAELSEKEMSDLGTAIMLRKKENANTNEMIGNIYLIKFFSTLEDAREISATINACSRMGYPDTSLGLCLGDKQSKKDAQKIYLKYKKTISSALGEIEKIEKLKGKDYIIINAEDKIRDTVVGTVASIMSFSPLYPEGTIIITMANTPNGKVKVSARVAGRRGKNVREILYKAIASLEGEVGGHPKAAGCLIQKDKLEEFITNLKNILEIELIKV